MLNRKSFGRASSLTSPAFCSSTSTAPSVCARLPCRPAPRRFSCQPASAAAVQMADQRDGRRHQRDADDVVSDEPHQLADDRVEHACVRHDAEIQHREDEQRGGGAGAVKAGFDHRCEVVKAVTAAENQNQAQDRREDDEGDGGLRLAFEKRDDDGDDADEAENADDGIAHGGKKTPFVFVFMRCPARRLRARRAERNGQDPWRGWAC